MIAQLAPGGALSLAMDYSDLLLKHPGAVDEARELSTHGDLFSPMADPEPGALLAFLQEMEFRTLTTRVAQTLGVEGAPPPSSSAGGQALSKAVAAGGGAKAPAKAPTKAPAKAAPAKAPAKKAPAKKK